MDQTSHRAIICLEQHACHKIATTSTFGAKIIHLECVVGMHQPRMGRAATWCIQLGAYINCCSLELQSRNGRTPPAVRSRHGDTQSTRGLSIAAKAHHGGAPPQKLARRSTAVRPIRGLGSGMQNVLFRLINIVPRSDIDCFFKTKGTPKKSSVA